MLYIPSPVEMVVRELASHTCELLVKLQCDVTSALGQHMVFNCAHVIIMSRTILIMSWVWLKT